MAECVWPGLRSIGLLMKGRRRTQYSRKKRQRKANSEKTESINLVASAFVCSVDLRELMLLVGT